MPDIMLDRRYTTLLYTDLSADQLSGLRYANT